MPSVKENLAIWGKNSNWSQAGDEWSGAWGGSRKQWERTIFPRIDQYLPVKVALEIAPGFGRWTEFLRSHCERLIAVDLNSNCIEMCKKRFAGDAGLSFYVNDGRSLPAVADSSVDFAFSFDSLVHVEEDVIDAYLAELARVLTPTGIAFIHHSNFGAYCVGPIATRLSHVPVLRHLRPYLRVLGAKPNPHWRGESVSAANVRNLARKHNLACISQELINWGADFANDCFSIVSRQASECRVIENLQFMREAEQIRLS
jgi:SAM-dependent methyltransferase